MEGKNQGSLRAILKSLLPLIIFAAIIGVLTLILLPEISRITTDEGREAFKAFVEGIGFWGWLVTLGIQLLQIFVAFIPGEPVELMLGFVWGPWLGTFTCLFGVFIGSAVIFFLVRRFGMKFLVRAVGTDDLRKYSFLSDEKKVSLTLFILFFIPGTPKDVITYIAPIAPIGVLPYLLITTFARIPSIVTSTLLGDSIREGDYLGAVIIFAVTALISLLGIIFGPRYVRGKSKEKEDENTPTK